MKDQRRPWSAAFAAVDELVAFWRSPAGSQYATGWRASRTEQLGIVDVNVAQLEAYSLRRSSLYWVRDEMTRVVLHAAASMPPQVLEATDLPVPFGFVVFERPMVFKDAAHKDLNIGAMGWQVVGYSEALSPGEMGAAPLSKHDRSGVAVTLYSDSTCRDGYYVDLAGARLPRYLLAHWDHYVFGAPPYDDEMIANVLMPARFGGGPVPEGEVREEYKRQRAMPFALWTLIQQPLARTTSEAPDRATRRRLEREGSPLVADPIRVVTLRRERRPTPEPHEAEPVDWSHRWIVSGHWRNQYLRGSGKHRLQWIDAFVKGPADKPLVIKQTVNALVR